MTDAIGHAGYLIIAYGTWMVAAGKNRGWLVRIIGQLIWLGLGLHLQLTSIFLWELIFVTIDARGYYNATSAHHD